MELVSIITPLFNAEEYILDTAESIKTQTYQHWEWIIVNDCSTDSSLRIVKELESKDPRVKVISNNKNLKAAQSRNAGISAAEGRFIAFLDSDDIWAPEKLEKQIKFMSNNNSTFSYHAYRKFRENIKNAGSIINVPAEVTYKDLLKTDSIPCLSVMYDALALRKFEMPDGYPSKEDYLCWLSILKEVDRAHGMSESLAYYRILPNSFSANKIRAAKLQWQVYRSHEKLNVFESSLSFVFYALHGLLKYRIH